MPALAEQARPRSSAHHLAASDHGGGGDEEEQEDEYTRDDEGYLEGLQWVDSMQQSQQQSEFPSPRASAQVPGAEATQAQAGDGGAGFWAEIKSKQVAEHEQQQDGDVVQEVREESDSYGSDDFHDEALERQVVQEAEEAARREQEQLQRFHLEQLEQFDGEGAADASLQSQGSDSAFTVNPAHLLLPPSGEELGNDESMSEQGLVLQIPLSPIEESPDDTARQGQQPQHRQEQHRQQAVNEPERKTQEYAKSTVTFDDALQQVDFGQLAAAYAHEMGPMAPRPVAGNKPVSISAKRLNELAQPKFVRQLEVPEKRKPVPVQAQAPPSMLTRPPKPDKARLPAGPEPVGAEVFKEANERSLARMRLRERIRQRKQELLQQEQAELSLAAGGAPEPSGPSPAKPTVAQRRHRAKSAPAAERSATELTLSHIDSLLQQAEEHTNVAAAHMTWAQVADAHSPCDQLSESDDGSSYTWSALSAASPGRRAGERDREQERDAKWRLPPRSRKGLFSTTGGSEIIGRRRKSVTMLPRSGPPPASKRSRSQPASTTRPKLPPTRKSRARDASIAERMSARKAPWQPPLKKQETAARSQHRSNSSPVNPADAAPDDPAPLSDVAPDEPSDGESQHPRNLALFWDNLEATRKRSGDQEAFEEAIDLGTDQEHAPPEQERRNAQAPGTSEIVHEQPQLDGALVPDQEQPASPHVTFESSPPRRRQHRRSVSSPDKSDGSVLAVRAGVPNRAEAGVRKGVVFGPAPRPKEKKRRKRCVRFCPQQIYQIRSTNASRARDKAVTMRLFTPTKASFMDKARAARLDAERDKHILAAVDCEEPPSEQASELEPSAEQTTAQAGARSDDASDANRAPDESEAEHRQALRSRIPVSICKHDRPLLDTASQTLAAAAGAGAVVAADSAIRRSSTVDFLRNEAEAEAEAEAESEAERDVKAKAGARAEAQTPGSTSEESTAITGLKEEEEITGAQATAVAEGGERAQTGAATEAPSVKGDEHANQAQQWRAEMSFVEQEAQEQFMRQENARIARDLGASRVRQHRTPQPLYEALVPPAPDQIEFTAESIRDLLLHMGIDVPGAVSQVCVRLDVSPRLIQRTFRWCVNQQIIHPLQRPAAAAPGMARRRRRQRQGAQTSSQSSATTRTSTRSATPQLMMMTSNLPTLSTADVRRAMEEEKSERGDNEKELPSVSVVGPFAVPDEWQGGQADDNRTKPDWADGDGVRKSHFAATADLMSEDLCPAAAMDKQYTGPCLKQESQQLQQQQQHRGRSLRGQPQPQFFQSDGTPVGFSAAEPRGSPHHVPTKPVKGMEFVSDAEVRMWPSSLRPHLSTNIQPSSSKRKSRVGKRGNFTKRTTGASASLMQGKLRTYEDIALRKHPRRKEDATSLLARGEGALVPSLSAGTPAELRGDPLQIAQQLDGVADFLARAAVRAATDARKARIAVQGLGAAERVVESEAVGPEQTIERAAAELQEQKERREEESAKKQRQERERAKKREFKAKARAAKKEQLLLETRKVEQELERERQQAEAKAKANLQAQQRREQAEREVAEAIAAELEEAQERAEAARVEEAARVAEAARVQRKSEAAEAARQAALALAAEEHARAAAEAAERARQVEQEVEVEEARRALIENEEGRQLAAEVRRLQLAEEAALRKTEEERQRALEAQERADEMRHQALEAQELRRLGSVERQEEERMRRVRAAEELEDGDMSQEEEEVADWRLSAPHSQVYDGADNDGLAARPAYPTEDAAKVDEEYEMAQLAAEVKRARAAEPSSPASADSSVSSSLSSSSGAEAKIIKAPAPAFTDESNMLQGTSWATVRVHGDLLLEERLVQEETERLREEEAKLQEEQERAHCTEEQWRDLLKKRARLAELRKKVEQRKLHMEEERRSQLGAEAACLLGEQRRLETAGQGDGADADSVEDEAEADRPPALDLHRATSNKSDMVGGLNEADLGLRVHGASDQQEQAADDTSSVSSACSQLLQLELRLEPSDLRKLARAGATGDSDEYSAKELLVGAFELNPSSGEFQLLGCGVWDNTSGREEEGLSAEVLLEYRGDGDSRKFKLAVYRGSGMDAEDSDSDAGAHGEPPLDGVVMGCPLLLVRDVARAAGQMLSFPITQWTVFPQSADSRKHQPSDFVPTGIGESCTASRAVSPFGLASVPEVAEESDEDGIDSRRSFTPERSRVEDAEPEVDGRDDCTEDDALWFGVDSAEHDDSSVRNGGGVSPMVDPESARCARPNTQSLRVEREREELVRLQQTMQRATATATQTSERALQATETQTSPRLRPTQSTAHIQTQALNQQGMATQTKRTAQAEVEQMENTHRAIEIAERAIELAQGKPPRKTLRGATATPPQKHSASLSTTPLSDSVQGPSGSGYELSSDVSSPHHTHAKPLQQQQQSAQEASSSPPEKGQSSTQPKRFVREALQAELTRLAVDLDRQLLALHSDSESDHSDSSAPVKELEKQLHLLKKLHTQTESLRLLEQELQGEDERKGWKKQREKLVLQYGRARHKFGTASHTSQRDEERSFSTVALEAAANGKAVVGRQGRHGSRVQATASATVPGQGRSRPGRSRQPPLKRTAALMDPELEMLQAAVDDRDRKLQWAAQTGAAGVHVDGLDLDDLERELDTVWSGYSSSSRPRDAHVEDEDSGGAGLGRDTHARQRHRERQRRRRPTKRASKPRGDAAADLAVRELMRELGELEAQIARKEQGAVKQLWPRERPVATDRPAPDSKKSAAAAPVFKSRGREGYWDQVQQPMPSRRQGNIAASLQAARKGGVQ